MLVRKYKRLTELYCLLLLLLAGTVVYWPVVFHKAIPMAVDHALLLAPWEEARPLDMHHAQAPDAAVHTTQFFPWYRYLHEAAQNNQSILWDPYENCGMPFLALWKSRCLSPFSIPVYFLPLNYALQISILARILVAGLCAYYVARRLGISAPMALLVGVSYELSAPVFLWSGWPLSDSAPWIPLLVLFAERIVMGQYRQWPAGALPVVLMLLGGSPECAVGGVVFLLLYVTLRSVMLRRDRAAGVSAAVSIATALGVAIGAAAVQLLPYIEFAGKAATTETTPTLLHWQDAIRLLLPHFAGEPGTLTHGAMARVPASLYAGLVPVFFAIVWLSLRPSAEKAHRRRMEALLLSSVLAFVLGIAYDTVHPSALPGLGLHGVHFVVAVPFTLALTAAITAEEWLLLDPQQCYAAIRRMLVLIPLAVALGAMAIAAARLISDPPAEHLTPQIFIFAAGSLVVLLILAGSTVRPSAVALGTALTLFTALDLGHAFVPAQSYVHPEQVFPETRFIQTLQGLDARVAGTNQLRDWPLSGNRIAQVSSAGGQVLESHKRFMERVADDPLLLRRTGSASLLLTKEDMQGSFASVRPMLKIREVFASGAILVDDLAMRPLAWTVFDWRTTSTFSEDELSSQAPPLVEGAALPAQIPGATGKVEVEQSSRSDRIALQTKLSAPGILLIANTWYPGWEATVDNEAVPLLRAEGLFQAIELGSGAHNVVLQYRPFSFRAGLGITVAALVVLAGGFLNILIRYVLPRKQASEL